LLSTLKELVMDTIGSVIHSDGKKTVTCIRKVASYQRQDAVKEEIETVLINVEVDGSVGIPRLLTRREQSQRAVLQLTNDSKTDNK
jgi:hypothetical protein